MGHSGSQKTHFTKITTAFDNLDHDGAVKSIGLVVPQGMTITGNLVLFPQDESEKT